MSEMIEVFFGGGAVSGGPISGGGVSDRVDASDYFVRDRFMLQDSYNSVVNNRVTNVMPLSLQTICNVYRLPSEL